MDPESTFETVGNFKIDTSYILGRGSFAKVYKAYGIGENSIKSAVKKVPTNRLKRNQDDLNRFLREIEILRHIKDENIVRLLHVETTADNLYIFMEYCNGGTLQSKLKEKGSFDEEEACSILKQIANAFVNLQNVPRNDAIGSTVTIMHRDIKPANILFHKGKVKIADFGFAKMISHHGLGPKLKRTHTICGTPLYEAPQIMERQEYSPKCDVWSAGVLFYQMIFGVAPWPLSMYDLTERIKARPLYFPKEVGYEIKSLINKMLMVNEEDRLSWTEVINHPALNKEDKVLARKSSYPLLESKAREALVQMPNYLIEIKENVLNKKQSGSNDENEQKITRGISVSQKEKEDFKNKENSIPNLSKSLPLQKDQILSRPRRFEQLNITDTKPKNNAHTYTFCGGSNNDNGAILKRYR